MSESWRQDCSDGSCSGGKKSLTVVFEMGARNTLPCTLVNLSQVNYINYAKRSMNIDLCVQDKPGQTNPAYDCIQFAEVGKANAVFGFSMDAQAAVVRLMRVITGQRFVIGYEDEHRIIYWRKDLAEQIAAFEQHQTRGGSVKPITVRDDPMNRLPCAKCGQSTAHHFDCPACGKEFCGGCFQEIPEGDGHSCYCPHCKTEVLLPPIG